MVKMSKQMKCYSAVGWQLYVSQSPVWAALAVNVTSSRSGVQHIHSEGWLG